MAELKPKWRTRQDFEQFQPLNAAEMQLVHACHEGALPSPAHRPTAKPSADQRIRSNFLRFLVLGGDETPVQRGATLANSIAAFAPEPSAL
jgi:hypothetical protein